MQAFRLLLSIELNLLQDCFVVGVGILLHRSLLEQVYVELQHVVDLTQFLLLGLAVQQIDELIHMGAVFKCLF